MSQSVTVKGVPKLPEDPKARIVLALWDAVARGDGDALAGLVTPDLVWHASGRGKLAGDKVGAEAVFEYLGEVGTAADEFSSEFDEVLVGETKVAVLFHVRGRRQGRTLQTDFILLFEVREGRVTEIWSIPRDQLSVDEFWNA